MASISAGVFTVDSATIGSLGSLDVRLTDVRGEQYILVCMTGGEIRSRRLDPQRLIFLPSKITLALWIAFRRSSVKIQPWEQRKS